MSKGASGLIDISTVAYAATVNECKGDLYGVAGEVGLYKASFVCASNEVRVRDDHKALTKRDHIAVAFENANIQIIKDDLLALI